MNDLAINLGVTTPQSAALIPEAFQQTLVDNITANLQLQNPPPCLLRAPTGSGKTFILSRVMANISAKEDVLWFWFVPYVNLVNQTLDALITNAGDLSPAFLSNGINQEPEAGQVLISTTQGVSKKAWRNAGYDVGGGELIRTAAEFVQLVRSQGMSIGVVVDEAHIALDEATEFGQFVSWLDPTYLLMATATPKSDRINQFLASAQYGNFESFSISRDDVVKARLNKAFIEAVVYDVRQTTSSVANLKRTVLKQAWLRNQKLKADLEAAGIPINPLLLVQVDNGADAIDEAEQFLTTQCRVPPQAIGKHSADTPDPVLMSSIAVDSSKEVLIFKQSAGTGFDAPRAFVLASTKAVNDADFAMQFIGRVMRVSRVIRATYSRASDIPDDFNTAYVYLANADAQKGYQQAIQVTDSIRSSLEAETERLKERVTRGGATLYTNKPSTQREITSRLPLPSTSTSTTEAAGAATTPVEVDTANGGPLANDQHSQVELWEGEAQLDQPAPEKVISCAPNPALAGTFDEWLDILKQRGLRAYTINRNVQSLPVSLKREDRPNIETMEAIVRAVATRVAIPDLYLKDAIRAALGRLREREVHTELTSGAIKADATVVIELDRDTVAKEARAVMNNLPQIEAPDHIILLDTLAKRIKPTFLEMMQDMDLDTSDSAELKRSLRMASEWLVRILAKELEEGLYAEIAKRATSSDAEPLPDVMLFPADIGLMPSKNNLYGVLPPSHEALDQIESTMLYEDRVLMSEGEWVLGSSGDTTTIRAGRYDKTFSLNNDELAFARALDRADYVAWWFRNPDKKPYAVRLLRGEHNNFFYPDFVVCLSHVDGDTPVQRLVETKHDVKDARRKSMHVPGSYGQVLFLTRDAGKLYVVTPDGGIGDEVNLDDTEALRRELQKTMPSTEGV
ncbi:DEAD/DEAH box helicase family protein [Marinobacter alkaliphilus]|uniref:DEAD/DEAH box helicase family protein n=1 Tax=Marinobacter alkaliphilus TaxID=254719 RepID=A0ABZ3EA95_9GAMM